MTDELARVKQFGKAPDRCPEKLRLVRSILDAWLGDRGKEVTMNDDDMATLRLAFKESEERAANLLNENAKLLTLAISCTKTLAAAVYVLRVKFHQNTDIMETRLYEMRNILAELKAMP